MSGIVPVLPGLSAHSSGGLFITDSATLVLADVHLGYSWAQRRRGELGPLADEKTRDKLQRVVEELHPRRIVFLGDLVHAPKSCEPERAWIEAVLLGLGERAELIAVRGNHDRAFAREFGHLPVRTIPAWVEGGLLALHGDKLPTLQGEGGTVLVGHLHPVLVVRDAAGAPQKLPVFLVTNACVLLPAFSPFAGGYDLADGLPDELKQLFGKSAIQAYATSPTRVLRVGPLQRSLERALKR